MDNKFKLVLFFALVLYVISPVDAVPGPIDDAILCVLYLITARSSN